MGSGRKAGQMDRRDFLAVGSGMAAAALLASLGVRRAAGEGAAAKRPNIVFVFSDEHRWCSLPFTEMREVVAPNMTKLAQQGMSFNNCISTSPICTPYRGMLLTGRWPHESSCISNDYFGNSKIIGVEGDTIAQTLKRAGYTTGYVGKWHLDEESVYGAGFDYFKHWLYGDDHQASKYRDVPSHEEYKVYSGYNAIGMTDQALEFLGAHAKDEKPFLLMLSLNPPHFRWDDAPAEDLKLYPAEKIPYRPNVTEPKFREDPTLTQYRHYHAHITAVDRELGRVMETLAKLGLEENTVVIYTSDHGSSWGSNGVSNKANPYDEAIRVPFLVRWPGHVPAGKTVDNLLGTVDIHATLCALAGAAVPRNCGGQDFSPVMLGKAGAGGPDPATQLIMVNNFQRSYFASQVAPKGRDPLPAFRGVRSKQYTYVVGAKGDWLLFDDKKDPYQLHNLVDDPAYADVKKELAKELKEWLAKAEDPYIPAEWRQLSLPERIAVENRRYSLLPYQKQWDKLKADALAPYEKGATPEQQKQLKAAAERIMDEAYFGKFKAYDNEVHTDKRPSKRPLEELKAELAAHEQQGLALLKAAAEKILAGGK